MDSSEHQIRLSKGLIAKFVQGLKLGASSVSGPKGKSHRHGGFYFRYVTGTVSICRVANWWVSDGKCLAGSRDGNRWNLRMDWMVGNTPTLPAAAGAPCLFRGTPTAARELYEVIDLTKWPFLAHVAFLQRLKTASPSRRRLTARHLSSLCRRGRKASPGSPWRCSDAGDAGKVIPRIEAGLHGGHLKLQLHRLRVEPRRTPGRRPACADAGYLQSLIVQHRNHVRVMRLGRETVEEVDNAVHVDRSGRREFGRRARKPRLAVPSADQRPISCHAIDPSASLKRSSVVEDAR